jgi:hypothetical protein
MASRTAAVATLIQQAHDRSMQAAILPASPARHRTNQRPWPRQQQAPACLLSPGGPGHRRHQSHAPSAGPSYRRPQLHSPCRAALRRGRLWPGGLRAAAAGGNPAGQLQQQQLLAGQAKVRRFSSSNPARAAAALAQPPMPSPALLRTWRSAARPSTWPGAAIGLLDITPCNPRAPRPRLASSMPGPARPSVPARQQQRPSAPAAAGQQDARPSHRPAVSARHPSLAAHSTRSCGSGGRLWGKDLLQEPLRRPPVTDAQRCAVRAAGRAAVRSQAGPPRPAPPPPPGPPPQARPPMRPAAQGRAHARHDHDRSSAPPLLPARTCRCAR